MIKMATDIDEYIDILQQTIDDLKNRPKETEILSVIICHHNGTIHSTVFSNASDDIATKLKHKLADTAADILHTIH
jgi:hypothetical protein